MHVAPEAGEIVDRFMENRGTISVNLCAALMYKILEPSEGQSRKQL